MFADLRSRDLLWRVAVVVAAAVAAALAAPTAVAAPLVAVAAYAAVDSLVWHRRRGWVDELVVGTAGLLIALVLLGLLLDRLPSGLTRVAWAVGAGIVALAGVLWGFRKSGPVGPVPESTELSWDAARPRLRSVLRDAPWYLTSAALVIVAIVISVRATTVANRPPLQLSIAGQNAAGVACVHISTDRQPGRYQLVVDDGADGSATSLAPFRLGKGQTVRYPLPLVAGRRTTVALRKAGSTTTLRMIIVSRAAGSRAAGSRAAGSSAAGSRAAGSSAAGSSQVGSRGGNCAP